MAEMDALPLDLVSAHMHVDLAACQLAFAIVNTRNDLIEDVPLIVSFLCLQTFSSSAACPSLAYSLSSMSTVVVNHQI
jgi:hypothetical protein